MTTRERFAEREAVTGRSGGSVAAPGLFARWWASWRVAVRMARRDARRYRWRSALIAVMVGLPVLLLTGGITLLATNDVSMAESVPRVMGSAQARLSEVGMGGLTQSPDGHLSGNGGQGRTPPLAVAGFAPGSGWSTGKVQRLTGGHVVQISNGTIRVSVGDRRPGVPVLGVDAREPLVRGLTDLASGRWASGPTEIVVTKAGVQGGLPSEGKLVTVGPGATTRQLTVVGVATSQTDNGVPFLIALPQLVTAVSNPEGISRAFLVDRADPVTWTDVKRLNQYGLLVQSRQVFLNPPAAADLDPQVAQSLGSDQRRLDIVLLLAAVGLFIETTLLAGPAFAVGAARQRRSLALAASNGAEARQLRRYVLGQAVVLGVVSAGVAVVAGVLLALAGLTWWQAAHADFVVGPFEVSWPRVAGVFLCAVVASVVAALLPAWGIARLDIVSVLAGRSGDRSVRRGLPVAGCTVMVVSGMGLLWAVSSGGEGGLLVQGYLIVIGAIGLVVGCLMVIPAVLALVGRLGSHLVIPLRLAARDTARQRGRSTPAVAAIMAAVAALTALSIGAASDTRQQLDAYKPQRPMGAGVIVPTGENRDDRSVGAVLTRSAPQLQVDREALVVDLSPAPMSSTRTTSWVSPVPLRCTEAQIVAIPNPGGAHPCSLLAAGGYQVNVGDLPGLSAKLALSKSQRAVLEGGGILTTDPGLVQGGTLKYLSGTASRGRSDAPLSRTITQRGRLQAALVDPRFWDPATHGGGFGAWVLSGTATKLGWPVQTLQFNLTSPTGTISPQVERAVADRLGEGYLISVERGFQNPYWLILLICFSVAGLLVLIASLISTALSLAESHSDMATLAAVGATRHTRRGIAAGQAFLVAACGCVLGVAVGLVPGIAITWPLTLRNASSQTVASRGGPVIEIPWLPLFAVVVLVPLVAAALAWVAVRRHPQVTRRLA